MPYVPLNTPAQARSLSILYGASLNPASKLVVIGNEKYIESWIARSAYTGIYALRTWDEEKIQSISDCHAFYLHTPPNMKWEQTLSFINADNHCVIRHGLPIGTALKKVQELIPTEYHGMLPSKSSYGMLMNRLLHQETPRNPISLHDLCSLMKVNGWYYACDLSTYRDFGTEEMDIVKRDALCGLVWRESMFMRREPVWNIDRDVSFSLHWRIQQTKPAHSGWIYTTTEGLQLGFRGVKSLESYTDWEELVEDHREHIHSFIHSGLLFLGEV